MVATDLLDPPSIYISKKGTKSIKIGYDYHGPGFWRGLMVAADENYLDLVKYGVVLQGPGFVRMLDTAMEYRGKLEDLCQELEKGS